MKQPISEFIDEVLWTIPENNDGQTNEEVIAKARQKLLDRFEEEVTAARVHALEFALGIVSEDPHKAILIYELKKLKAALQHKESKE